MLIKLRMDEIVGQNSLAYDVFDGAGQKIYEAGDTIDSRKLRRIADNGLFRKQEKLSLEWILQTEFPNVLENKASIDILLQGEDNAEEEEELSFPFLLNREEATPYLESMFSFWKKLEQGHEIDIAMLEVIDSNLISQVISKMDQLRYLNQLRIRDGITYSHTLDVTTVSIALGLRLGLNRKDLESLALGALLHDLGKLFIPKAIMFKPTRLTDKEFEVMQLHPAIGYRIIREELKLPDEVARPALEHQELYAGGGYPQNLYGDEIHFFSQIVKIADVYDALTSKRPYKDSICSEKAIRIMLLEGGKSFNPSMLKIFLDLANYSGPIPDELADY